MPLVALGGCAEKSDNGLFTVGFVYIGSKDDYGYNQAHAPGAAAVKKMPGVKVIEEENGPRHGGFQKTMKSMIELDGAKRDFSDVVRLLRSARAASGQAISEGEVPPLRRAVG